MNQFEGDYSMLAFRKSHNLILYRSTPALFQNTDIIFHGVYYIDAPLQLSKFVISTASPEEQVMINQKCHWEVVEQYRTVFRPEMDDYRYFIGAFYYSILENDLGPDETSYHLFPDYTWRER